MEYQKIIDLLDSQTTQNLDGFFDQPVKNDLRTYDNMRRIEYGQGDDYTTGCLLDYPYLKENYKFITIDLSKQQALDANRKELQQINFTGNLKLARNTMFFS